MFGEKIEAMMTSVPCYMDSSCKAAVDLKRQWLGDKLLA
jgi:hypothetical protein